MTHIHVDQPELFRHHVQQDDGDGRQSQVIHQYLPREVGELAVYFVWLTIPFWRSVVQGASRGVADWGSPYI
jgi:hypothetical protein